MAATEPWYEVVSEPPGPEVTDPDMRRKIEASGHPWRVRDRATGIEMVLVMPGDFWMGSPESEPGRELDEGPRHRVRLTRPFYLGATEVTQAEWRRVMGVTQDFFRGDSLPADGSWDDLESFLFRANLTRSRGMEPLRAPTEAEWEYACRAGTSGPFSFDGPVGHDILNHNDGDARSARAGDGDHTFEWNTPPSPDCRLRTAPAGSLPPNAWGLHEMAGNIGEWLVDGYRPDAYVGRDSLTVDPVVPATEDGERVLRGGDWYQDASQCRSAARDGGGPHTRGSRMGFRVARTIRSRTSASP